MGETTADVRRDIEMTRERMSNTLAQLEHKLNVVEVVRDHPWPALALAFGAGLALSMSGADAKSAAVAVGATKGASSKVGSLLDELVASVMTGVNQAFSSRVDGWVGELKDAIGAPRTRTPGSNGAGYGVGPADMPGAAAPPNVIRAD
jgi:uncharacterized protein DUF3618